MARKGLVGGITLGVVLVGGLIIGCMCSKRIPAGYVGVKYNLSGGVQDTVLTQGLHFISPTTHVTLYSVGLEQSYLTSSKQGDSPDNESFSAASKEGKAMQIDLTYTYQYQPESVPSVFKQFAGQSGKEVRDSFIKPNIISKAKEVIARYKVSDILGEERSAVNVALTDYLSDVFDDYGITISNVSLINVDVDDATRDAINAKITAQQNAERQSIENQTNIDKAKADAEVATTNAQAQADAELIKAQAEAEANKKIAESLTDELIKSKYANRWNGDLPKVYGGNTGNLMDVSSMINETEVTE